MNEEQAAEVLRKSLATIGSDLGAMRGVPEESYEHVCEVLRFYAKRWRGRDMIPRGAMAELWGVTDLLIGASERYGAVEGPKIVDKAAHIHELVVACLFDAPQSQEL